VAELFRCAVVPAKNALGSAADVVAALGQCSEIDTFTCNSVSAHDVNLSGVVFVTGIETLEDTLLRIEEVRSHSPRAAILVAVAGAEAGMLETILTAGVFDFVSIPFRSSELIARFRRAVGIWPTPRRQNHQSITRPDIRGFVYASEEFAQLALKLKTVASCDANVLILGETGTGKEVCAQAVHYLSTRASHPWVAVNCGAIPAELVENELFGHVKGAYTTAHEARTGLVREAEGGTLFLDDIDCLPLSSQSKMLRFLQEREYRPVGGNTVMRANVRVIAASNCDLRALSLRGSFRQDLYFRLNVLHLALPPLRERRSDIPVLAKHFVRYFANEFHRGVSEITPSALRKLLAHNWPGNVRELKHVIERAVLLTSNPALIASDIEIDSTVVSDAADDSFRSAKSRVVRNFERGYLEQLLAASHGNITQAAEAAKKDRRAFFELIRKHEIEPSRFRRDYL
jgi:two-component system, NtrC family, response regulator GlrR